MSKASTQRTLVLQHLQSGASLTPLEAQRRYGVGRLAARIRELREAGYDIVDERKKSGVRYSVYRLEYIGEQGLLMALPAKGRPE